MGRNRERRIISHNMTTDQPARNAIPRLAALFLLLAAPGLAQPFDIAPFARRCSGENDYKLPTTFDYSLTRAGPQKFEKLGERYVYALQWAEERDIKKVQLRFAAPLADQKIAMDYWFQNWPHMPPKMPTYEDPTDDPWQGRWLRAESVCKLEDRECQLTFLPLALEENPKATNLPSLLYRRTLKIRLVSKTPPPALEEIRVFTESTQKTLPVRVELNVSEKQHPTWSGWVEAYNGAIRNMRGWKTGRQDQVNDAYFLITQGKGMVFDVLGANPAPSGSLDVTIVSVRAGERTFSFALPDVEKGPMYLPDFDAYVTLASDSRSFSPSVVKSGERIRQKLAAEPEQTYERATNEIPALDPVDRQGYPLFLPLAIDSSWQKFALEWGGHVHLHKARLKAKGKELKRLEWTGDRLDWRFGTGEKPTFRNRSEDSRLSVLEDFLPVTLARWKTRDIEYTQEAFATPLSGSLDWKGRDEQSPVALLVKITARNTAAQPGVSHLWLGINPSEPLGFEQNLLLAGEGQLVRARVNASAKTAASLATMKNRKEQMTGLHLQIELPPQGTDTTLFALPFIPRLTATEKEQLAVLDFDREREKVIRYWRPIAESGVRFEVPEKRFVTFAKAALVHMRLSTSIDPQSGLFMVPAASYSYQVYANEACFQVLMLDALGDHQMAVDYLETFVKLQGSRPFRGTYTGDQRDVFHGAKVSPGYDYTASEYNLDHGTVLWTLAEHYFTTRNEEWLRHVAQNMIRAADWVTDQRRQTMVGRASSSRSAGSAVSPHQSESEEFIPEFGLLPAGHLEDNSDWGHWFAINAYASAGMSRLSDALKDIRHPEAARIARDAEAYRFDLRRAVNRASQNAPVTRLRDNTFIPYVPVRVHQRQRLFGPLRAEFYRRYPNPVLPTYRLSATREVLYGPLILLNLGIFKNQEPLAGWVLDDWEDNLTMSSSLGLNPHGWVDDEYWFSRGGMVFQANLQNPVLAYLQRREIPAAIRNLYNDFVSCYYPDVNVFTEEYRQWRSPSGPFYKTPDEARFVARVRDLLVREDSSDLWLTAGTPRRWLAAGETIRFRQMPTTFGPVDLELNARENEIVGQVRLPSRNKFANAWLVLRVPESKKLSGIEIDGKLWRDFNRETGVIELPGNTKAAIQVKATLSAK